MYKVRCGAERLAKNFLTASFLSTTEVVDNLYYDSSARAIAFINFNFIGS